MASILTLNSIYKSFGNKHALIDAFFDLKKGEIHGLLGENGAGKSTLMNVVCGLYSQDKGKIELNGKIINIRNPINAKLLGIGMVHQHFKLVRNMTVIENLVLSKLKKNKLQSSKSLKSEIIRSIQNLNFKIEMNKKISELSVAEQQRVEIAKVLSEGSKIIILDEPTAVLTDKESNLLFVELKTLASNGCSIVVITHKLHEILGNADRVTIMRSGRTVSKSQNVKDLNSSDLSLMMIGEKNSINKREILKKGKKSLTLRNISTKEKVGTPKLNNFNLELYSGQIYGLAGVSGNGQTELAELLMGIKTISKGKIILEEKILKPGSPGNFRKNGISCIPAERYIYGLSGNLSVMENFSISKLILKRKKNNFWLDYKSLYLKCSDVIKKYNILGGDPKTKSRLLSGGNAQKLVLARELEQNSKIIVAQSPTRGLDIKACSDILNNLFKAAKNNSSVILISDDLDEIINNSDRIGVINRGKIVGEFEPPFDRKELGKLMVGSF